MVERESKLGFAGLVVLAGTAGLARFLGEIAAGVAVFLVALAAVGFIGALIRYFVVGHWGI